MATRPSSSIADFRPDLAGSLMEMDAAMGMHGYVGLRVAPPVNVSVMSGPFGVIPLEEMLKRKDTRRAPGAEYARIEGKFETKTFTCEEHGIEEAVDDRESKMYQDYFDSELLAARRAQELVVSNFERRIVTLADAVTGAAAAAAWNLPATATPIVDVRTAVLAMAANGVVANCIVIPWTRAQFLKDCAEIVDRIKYSGLQDPLKRSINADTLAAAFDLPYVLFAGAIHNTANEGQAASYADLWTVTRAIVCRIPETADHREPCWLRTFHYSEDGSAVGGVVETYRDETRRSDIVRCRMDTDELVVYSEAARAITDI